MKRILNPGPFTTIEENRYDAALLLCDGIADELRRNHGVRIDISDGTGHDRGRPLVIKGEEGRRTRAEEAIREVLRGKPGQERKVDGITSPEHNGVKKSLEKKDLDKDVVNVKSGLEED